MRQATLKSLLPIFIVLLSASYSCKKAEGPIEIPKPLPTFSERFDEIGDWQFYRWDSSWATTYPSVPWVGTIELNASQGGGCDRYKMEHNLSLNNEILTNLSDYKCEALIDLFEVTGQASGIFSLSMVIENTQYWWGIYDIESPTTVKMTLDFADSSNVFSCDPPKEFCGTFSAMSDATPYNLVRLQASACGADLYAESYALVDYLELTFIKK